MGFFDPLPPKRVTPHELHAHVVGQLKTGDHALTENQAHRFHEVVSGYMDADTARFKNHPGLTAQELPTLIQTLKDDQHGTHGNHLNDHQIGKIEHVLQKYIDHHVSN
jgi:hypothetical protein